MSIGEIERDREAAKAAVANPGINIGWAACEAAVRTALEADPDSELWGEHGLLAATMRCVRSVREREDDGK